ncbi:conserved hypothetical protein [Mesorhizobium sp. ORS 3324]|nr:conserved hypothetical protein [Mesorhizobium sp. ORS 3324]
MRMPFRLAAIVHEQAMPNASYRFFVLTGGPGSGKTTLIETLKSAGFATAPEAGRGIIRDQMAIGGPALPLLDPALFAELMLSWELRSWHAAQGEPAPVFFDRGVPDTIGYLRLCGLPVPDHIRSAATTFRYARHVFIAPPWPEIFVQDEERRQTLDRAERTFQSVTSAYAELGYELVLLPLVPVEERVCFILDAAGLPRTGKRPGRTRPFRCFRGSYSAGASTASRARPSVSLARLNEITAQSVMPATIGSGVPSKNRPATPIASAPMAKCSVPINAEAVPAISPCSSMASTEVVGMTRPRKP